MAEHKRSILCDHHLVCARCKRVRCIENMVHTRLYGYQCVCGSSEWIHLAESMAMFIEKLEAEQAEDGGFCHKCNTWHYGGVSCSCDEEVRDE